VDIVVIGNKMTNKFEFINAVTIGKNDLIRDSFDPEATEKEYSPFMTNRAISYHMDCILMANEMNRMPNLPKQLQFDFLRLGLNKRKRFAKWAKATQDEDLKVIMEYYKISMKKAKTTLAILSKKQLSMIKERIKKGGKSNE